MQRRRQDAAAVRTLGPIAGDATATADAVEPLARQVTAMQRFLGQYRPTISLGRDARLMYVMAEDPNADTSALYPRIYAKPLLNDNPDVSAQFARIGAQAEQLKTKMRAFTVQHLPGRDSTSLQAHAVPLGFVPVRGCDPNWNGKGWTVTRGSLPLSEFIPGHGDIDISESGFSGKTGMLYLRLDVQFANDADGSLTITNAAVAFAEGDVFSATGMAYEPKAKTWTPGTIISPLNYLLAPNEEREAPVVLKMGNGEFPTKHFFALPFTIGGLTPP